MNPRTYQEYDEAELLGEYAALAKRQTSSSEAGDHQAANEQFDAISAIYAELKSRGLIQRGALLRFLSDESDAVKGWAAVHALEFFPADGERVLEALSGGAGLWKLTARMTLREWRNGNLSFP